MTGAIRGIIHGASSSIADAMATMRMARAPRPLDDCSSRARPAMTETTNPASRFTSVLRIAEPDAARGEIPTFLDIAPMAPMFQILPGRYRARLDTLQILAALQNGSRASQQTSMLRHVWTRTACPLRKTAPERITSPQRGERGSGWLRSSSRPCARVRPTMTTTTAARIQLRMRSALRLRRGTVDGLAVDVGVAMRRPIRRERGACLDCAAPAELLAAVGPLEQRGDGSRERFRSPVPYEDAGLAIAYDVHHPAGGEADHRRLAQVRFDGDEAESFFRGGDDERTCATVERGELGGGSRTMPAHAVRHAKR